MSDSGLLPCDGCGQPADSAHISRRLQRLTWATRFRPVHIHTLLVGGVSPKPESEYLYAPESFFSGEAGLALAEAGILPEGKSVEAVLTEFQKAGWMLIHILECPLEESVSEAEARELTEKALAGTLARIRRSFKPKRVLLLGSVRDAFAERLR